MITKETSQVQKGRNTREMTTEKRDEELGRERTVKEEREQKD